MKLLTLGLTVGLPILHTTLGCISMPSCQPRGCRWSSWGLWGQCAPTAEWSATYQQTRYRVKVREETCGGLCGGTGSQTRKCCGLATDCQWGAWGEWDNCTGSRQFRSRVKTVPEKCGGTCTGAFRMAKSCEYENTMLI